MQNTSLEHMRAFAGRMKPIYRQIFLLAHIICGNYEQAEHICLRAMVDCYKRHGMIRSRHAFEEQVRSFVCRYAYESTCSSDGAELNWKGFGPLALNAEQTQEKMLFDVYEEIANEEIDVQRGIVMHFACGMSEQKISDILLSASEGLEEYIKNFKRNGFIQL